MRSTLKLPKTAKGWFSLLLIIFTVFVGGWPIIPIVNKPTLFLGMPLIMVWSVFIIFLTTFSMWLINKIGVDE